MIDHRASLLNRTWQGKSVTYFRGFSAKAGRDMQCPMKSGPGQEPFEAKSFFSISRADSPVSFRAPRRHARRKPIHIFGPVGQIRSRPIRVAVQRRYLWRLIRSSTNIKCRSFRCAKVQPNRFPPRKLVERRIHQAAPQPRQQKSHRLRPDAPQRTYLCSSTTPKYPAILPTAWRRRKARKPPPPRLQHRTKRSPLQGGRSTISQRCDPHQQVLPRPHLYRRKNVKYRSWGSSFHATARSSRPNISWL